MKTEREIQTATTIAASPERVWRELTTFSEYPKWSRFIHSVEGIPRAGARLKVLLRRGPASVTIRPELLVADENRQLCWRKTFGAGLVFSGEHYFELGALPDGRTHLKHGERLRGVVSLLGWNLYQRRVHEAFADFNEALRARAEAPGAQPEARAHESA